MWLIQYPLAKRFDCSESVLRIFIQFLLRLLQTLLIQSAHVLVCWRHLA